MAHGVQNNPKKELILHDGLTFYPAYCYKASPTHFTWVKLSAVNVHHLTRRSGYEGQNIYFYKNHPIQFICLAGVIVSREEHVRRTILTLDDSSGSNIEIICSKKQVELDSQPVKAETGAAVAAAGTTRVSEYITSTTKEALDIQSLVPGVIAKFKGTVITFRNIKQLHLERFVLLPDMAGEMRFWEERTRFLIDVLSVPWYLTSEQVEQLRIEGVGLEEKQRKRSKARELEKQRRERKRAEREEKDYERIVRRYQREEEVRRKYTESSRELSARFKKVGKR
ncbi:hypothetical protein H109_07475 [Trichophyton interdigitale MR816]|uniref:CST complex subunit Stn1 N-terminal domain-containing protein n=1 Tax=Trichophyton interdigitale (strain MR816) TaxID=1215338 RepID=A0A059IY87_TRIIM|nr:hypothetical protein H101_03603 [Trichophyton interdigitale H6]KDB20570.1 hypothetical protein H109_07475 [Trichophyton interdigitale MR816]